MKINKLPVIITVVLWIGIFTPSCSSENSAPPACVKDNTNPAPACSAVKDPNAIDPASPLGQLLDKINQTAKNIKSCQANLDYLYIQEPELLDSRTLRKGVLYYNKNEKGSKLRLNFETLQQDKGQEQNKKEYYFFDGIWLTKVDYSLRQIDQYQQAPVDKPADVFDYISHNFPIVGFTGSDVLQKEFILSLIAPLEEEKNLHHLLLKVKLDSVYKDDYSQIDLWIDAKTYLPVRLVSVSVQGDIYDMKLSKMELNKNIPEKVFNLETPPDFSKNVRILEQKNERKDSKWPQDL